MANARSLDKEVSPNDRPRRPDHLPAGAPDSPVVPEQPDTAGEKQALAAEIRNSESADRPQPDNHGEQDRGKRSVAEPGAARQEGNVNSR